MNKAEIATQLWKAILSNPNTTISVALTEQCLFERVQELAERIYKDLA
jgi:hypothetical protein